MVYIQEFPFVCTKRDHLDLAANKPASKDRDKVQRSEISRRLINKLTLLNRCVQDNAYRR